MKKRFIAALVLLVLLFVPFVALAEEPPYDEERYGELLSAYDLSAFEEELDSDTYDMLQSLGLLDFSYESLSGLQPDAVLTLLRDLIAEKIRSPLGSVSALLIFIVLSALFSSLGSEESSMTPLYSTVSALVIAAVLIVKLSPAVSLAATAIGVAADFIYAFMPMFVTIVIAGGGVTTGFATNAMLLMLSQGLSVLASQLFMPLTNCFLAIGICSSLKSDLRLDGVTRAIKQGLTGLLSFTAGSFVAVLSLKTAVASRADRLGVRSLRLVINSVVPVVGSALSEGLLSIESYASLIKSSVGIVGIAAVTLVFLPSLVELLLWRAVLRLAGILCTVFDDQNVSGVLNVFADTVLLINVVLIVSALTTVITIGILIAAGG